MKRRLYAEAGVGEYWIVDPAARAVEVFASGLGGLEPAGWFTGVENVPSRVLPGLTLSVARVFE